MRDQDTPKRIILIWEKTGSSTTQQRQESKNEGEATVTVTPLGDANAPELRVVSSGFGQTARVNVPAGSPTAHLRCAA